MKYTATVALAILTTIGSAQAGVTTIKFELSRGNEQSVMVDSSGTITTSKFTTATGGNPQTAKYTITGLTLDSVGSEDDSITFDMVLTGTGSGAIDGFASIFDAWGVQDDNGTRDLVDTDETMTFSFSGATVTLGNGAIETATIQFDGFSGFRALNVEASETYDITGTTGSNVTDTHPTHDSLYALTGGLENSFTIKGNTGAMRYYHIASQVTITTSFSEQSASALISIGGISVILHNHN